MLIFFVLITGPSCGKKGMQTVIDGLVAVGDAIFYCSTGTVSKGEDVEEDEVVNNIDDTNKWLSACCNVIDKNHEFDLQTKKCVQIFGFKLKYNEEQIQPKTIYNTVDFVNKKLTYKGVMKSSLKLMPPENDSDYDPKDRLDILNRKLMDLYGFSGVQAADYKEIWEDFSINFETGVITERSTNEGVALKDKAIFEIGRKYNFIYYTDTIFPLHPDYIEDLGGDTFEFIGDGFIAKSYTDYNEATGESNTVSFQKDSETSGSYVVYKFSIHIPNNESSYTCTVGAAACVSIKPYGLSEDFP